MNCPEDVLDFCPHALQGNSAVVFVALINALFSSKCKMDPRKEFKEDFGENIQEQNEFDFIIIGGGTSGCVLANRLSENPNWKVLLLEAGGYPNSESEIPMFYNDVLKTPLDWDFDTEHLNTTCSGFKNSRCRWSKGKALGGSSTINDMLFLPSVEQDFAVWEHQLNIKGWSWDEVSEYYEKARGMLEATTPKSTYGIRDILAEAMEEMGIRNYRDTRHNKEGTEEEEDAIGISIREPNNREGAGENDLKGMRKSRGKDNREKTDEAGLNGTRKSRGIVNREEIDEEDLNGMRKSRRKDKREETDDKDLNGMRKSSNKDNKEGINEEELNKMRKSRAKVHKEGFEEDWLSNSKGIVKVGSKLILGEDGFAFDEERKGFDETEFATKRGKGRKGGFEEVGFASKERIHRGTSKHVGITNKEEKAGEEVSGFGGAKRKNLDGFRVTRGDFYEDAFVTIKNSKRFSSAKAYLAPVKYRNNLFVMTKAMVTKILLTRGKATGVTISWDEEFLNVTASMEVILAAGSVNSPKLLLLSGIGPQSHLQKMSIPASIPSPVGNHLQDQIGVLGVFVELDANAVGDAKFGQDDVYKYLTAKAGPLAHVGLANFLLHLSTSGQKTPNVKIQTFVYPKHDGHSLRTNTFAYSFNQDSTSSLINSNKRHALLHFVITLLKPESSGKIRLESSNPYKNPQIHPRYFTHKNDLQTLLDSLKRIKKLLSAPALAKLNPKFLNFDLPNCNNLEFDSDEYWECNFRLLSTSTGTQVGGCRMGSLDDHGTVVDEKLMVKGVAGLRVVDPSVVPTLGVGNYYAYAAMIGEKGADIIKQEWEFTI